MRLNSGEKTQKKEKIYKRKRNSYYENVVKYSIDRILSFCGLIVLAPLFIVISLAVFIDDPGPILFTQKRIGKDKRVFLMHKFRSMKIAAPHDVPTHQLSNPDEYITRIGRFLRKYSLDELPQIYDIFVGNMSIIGPRPALWNQYDLIEEREKYEANSVMPGLTGWAQINGRDELEISDKAKLDGEYVKYLRQGGFKALFFDIKCFVGTIDSVVKSKGIVEGGTGEINGKEKKYCSEKNEDYVEEAENEQNSILSTNRKKVLITGSGSYIGESFVKHIKKYYRDRYKIETVDMMSESWRETKFSEYEALLHVAGIVHRKDAPDELYEKVNHILAAEVARKAKEEGIGLFIFMSSAAVYCQSDRNHRKITVNENTKLAPTTPYGVSKMKAEQDLRKIAIDGEMKLAIVRPPMVYGADAKGNYNILSKLVKKIPIFPKINNRRSMIYIENLCEFIRLLIENNEEGVFLPQNKEYVNTSELAFTIAAVNKKHIILSPRFNKLIYLFSKRIDVINKVFGSYIYKPQNIYFDNKYQICDFYESICRTEKKK